MSQSTRCTIAEAIVLVLIITLFQSGCGSQATIAADPPSQSSTGTTGTSGNSGNTTSTGGSCMYCDVSTTYDPQVIGGIRLADAFPGTDAGAQIAAAIANLPPTGGTVDATGLDGSQMISTPVVINKPVKLILGASTYTATGTAFVVSSNGVSIEGKGALQTFLQTTSTNPLITNSTHVQGLNISGMFLTGPASGSNGSGLIDLNNVNTSTISNISTCGGYFGVHLQNTWNVWVMRMVVSGAIHAGLFLDGSTSNVIQSHFYDLAISKGLNDGVLISASTGEVDANTFINVTTSHNQDIGFNLQSANGSNSFFHCETTDELGAEQWNIATDSNSFYYSHAERTSATSSYDYLVSGSHNIFFYPRAYRGVPSGIYVTGDSNNFYYPFTTNTGTNAIEVSGQYNHFYSGWLGISPTGIEEDTGANFNIYQDIQMPSVTTPINLIGTWDEVSIVGQSLETIPSNLQIAGKNGASWTSAEGVPSMPCRNGSLYSNTRGVTGSTLYTCVNGSWVDVK